MGGRFWAKFGGCIGLLALAGIFGWSRLLVLLWVMLTGLREPLEVELASVEVAVEVEVGEAEAPQ